MAFANTAISDLAATGIDSRTGEIANNVLGNNPLLANLKKKGRVKTTSGGVTIVEELSFTTNPNGGAYDVHPYMLLNHTDNYEGLSTYAHEWGHAMHTLLAQKVTLAFADKGDLHGFHVKTVPDKFRAEIPAQGQKRSVHVANRLQ